MTISSQDVFEVVRRQLCEVVDTIEPDSVTRDASMKDLGASSLDMVEVVSCSMRELRVRVPRSELSKLKDIGELADLLHAAVREKEKQSASP